MELADRLLYHQIHPLTLFTDSSTAFGQYVRGFMTLRVEAARFAGDP